MNYDSSPTECTPLGEVQSFDLGKTLNDIYFDPSSPDAIKGIQADLADLEQIHVRVKNGGEGRVVFDSALAMLQGLFPPTEKNSIELANEQKITAPLGGYQYVPVETVEPSNDRSLESWTDCPAFEAHVKKVYGSSDFKEKAKEAQKFLSEAKDFVFGRSTSFENVHNIHDYMNDQLTHNRTYAHRLPPTFIEQARHWANYHESAVFGDSQMGGIGNIASRTLMRSIISTLQRITLDGDPLQFLVEATTYQPFISFFHQIDAVEKDPSLQAIPDYASAIAIELRRGELPDKRDFLRFKFRNGTVDDDFRLLHAFNHREDIPLTEFIYRIENSVIGSHSQWQRVCGSRSVWPAIPNPFSGIDNVETLPAGEPQPLMSAMYGAMFAALLMFLAFSTMKFARRMYNGRRIRLDRIEADEPVGISTPLIRDNQAFNEKRHVMFGM